MGTRGKRNKKVNVFEEPTLLSDVNKIKELATEKGMYNGEALDIEQLIQEISHREENAPILIKKIPMDNYLSGSLSYKDGMWIMTVNSKQHPKRQRFTLAHELAHYILHKEKIGDNLTDNAMYRSKLSNVFERQANILASEILMPVNFVMQFIEENKSVSEMASLFKVSEGAMRIRLRQGGDIFLAE